MASNLLIVESPAKAKTIEKYLGKDFKVKSSFGHIRELDRGNKGVDKEHDFKPNYIVSPDKAKVVSDLKDWVKKVETVWLATDEDREGEAISWHLCHVLGLDVHTTKRIVFHEITKSAIQNAITQPRNLDLNLVNAQQARRVLDRLVGFDLSPILWRKIKKDLSAGRVQSVAVKLIVDKEREILAFNSNPFFKVSSIFDVKNDKGKMVELKAERVARYDNEAEAMSYLNKCVKADFTINKIDVKPTKKKPSAPFTTSTLQQEASRKLGFSVKRTMVNAQKLYEQGSISYMRTDSVNLSEQAISNIEAEIINKFGKQYANARRYKTKKSNAQEAHEAIRPTDMGVMQATNDRDQQRLYELIWKRTIASQMSDAELEKTVVKIGISSMPNEELKADGEVLKFDGFLKVYLESKDDDDESEAKGILPPLKVGQVLDLNEMTAVERFTRAPARYTEAGLVKKMEEEGIGRPSTYAPTINKIMMEGRGYVVKESREGVERFYQVLKLKNDNVSASTSSEITGTTKNRLYPTDVGIIVVDFLSKHFQEIMNYSFTADVEKKFDKIAAGDQEWVDMIRDFYKDFEPKVQETLENAERESGERILGKDPETGRTLLVRINRFGKPMVQIGKPDELEEDEKPRYANLTAGQSLGTINFDEALKLFDLPKVLGSYQDQEVTVAIGRFGPYVKHNDIFISIPRGEDPYLVNMERAKELIIEKRKADAPIGTYQGIEYTKGKGRFGPFLKWNEMFINIPRRYDPENISTEDCHELIAAKVEKEKNRYIHQWPEQEISVENARWGPIIKFKKKKVKIPKNEEGKRITPEEAKEMTLEEVKKLIEAEIPDAFVVKEKKKKKKAPAKKKVPAKKKAAPKKK